MGEAAELGVGGDLTERSRGILRLLVERYIRDGQPVGSRTLSRAVELSPASIRNVMSDLEDGGYLISPHTSAGRIPTSRGFRFFVDSLLNFRPLDETSTRTMREQLQGSGDTSALVSSTSSALADLTRLAGIVTLPHGDVASLRRIEFLGLSDNRVLVILVVNDAEVENRVIQTDRNYSAAELERASNYLTNRFVGRPLGEMRSALAEDIDSARNELDHAMDAAVRMAEKALSKRQDSEDFVLSGQTNLMDFTELADVSHLRRLFDAFQEKQEILHLLDRCIDGQGVQIYIGEEAGYEGFNEMSLVTAPYTAGGRIVGVLGVIGPTRMAYDHVIPIVDLTAKLLTSALNSRH
ncbi:MAG: heat-inducible transcriptional repressor HrcA [Gammaproteobacteria bacterium]